MSNPQKSEQAALVAEVAQLLRQLDAFAGRTALGSLLGAASVTQAGEAIVILTALKKAMAYGIAESAAWHAEQDRITQELRDEQTNTAHAAEPVAQPAATPDAGRTLVDEAGR